MLYTIGYEGTSTESFVAELKAKGVDVLVDVREMPLSRKKGFSKNSLAALVNAAGIEYRHMRDLGAPREVRYRLKDTGDWSEYCVGYKAHLAECDTALAQVAELANAEAVCLMCFEADYRECHRSLIAERLSALGKVDAVEHLSPRTGSAYQQRMTA